MTPWEAACRAVALAALDPEGLGGVVLRSRPSPARDALLRLANGLRGGAPTRLSPQTLGEDLDGGIDLAATLQAGTLRYRTGLLQRKDAALVLTMAERTTPLVAGRLAQALDRGLPRGLIALDEGAEEEEALPRALADRLAFRVTLDGIALADIEPQPVFRAAIAPSEVRHAAADLESLTHLAGALGIAGLRAPLFALRAARANAALARRGRVAGEDLETAAALILAHRATCLPQEAPAPPEPEAPPPEPDAPSEVQDIPQDMLLEAVLAALPAGMLDALQAGQNRQAKGAGHGVRRTGNRRGRPLPARGAAARGSARIDLIASLRAALPWQTIRRQQAPDGPLVRIRPSDLRAKRYESHSDRLLIFAVDGSGSAALARLGEAKGAVELLLGEAYARRDHVALIAFRQTGAEVLLEPTRSLVQTKRKLAALPGGGGTPLAAGLLEASAMAERARRRGLAPVIVTLTDGRANVALDGSVNRARAAQDAQDLAAEIRALGHPSITIDTSTRPEPALRQLSQRMGGRYVALPRADARALSEAVAAQLDG